MAKIEKRYDKRGQLQWAKGIAREIHKDKQVNAARGLHFRLPGQTRWSDIMLPRHLASWETEGPPSPERLMELHKMWKVPIEEWTFVLIGNAGPDEDSVCIAQEIPGDQIVEVAVLPNELATAPLIVSD